jgi:hypothetical protein
MIMLMVVMVMTILMMSKALRMGLLGLHQNSSVSYMPNIQTQPRKTLLP